MMQRRVFEAEAIRTWILHFFHLLVGWVLQYFRF